MINLYREWAIANGVDLNAPVRVGVTASNPNCAALAASLGSALNRHFEQPGVSEAFRESVNDAVAKEIGLR